VTCSVPALGLSTSYTYDANKNLTSETLAPDNAAHVMRPFSFTADQDDEDRLIDWERGAFGGGGGEVRDWDLTLVGDWQQYTRDEDGSGGPLLPIVQPRNHTDAHEIDLVDGTAAEHDAKGNMTDDAGAGGNSGGGGGGGNPREFTYDFDNQLASVEMPDGKVHSFTYDALGRRVSQKVDTGVMGGGPYETTVYVCATHESGLGQVIAEYDAGQPASNPERHYVYGAYVDEPLVFLAPSAQSPAPTYYHRNRKYDILGLTSSTGTVLERYAYTPYGEVTFLNAVGTVQAPHASPLGNPYLFTGQRYDAAPALHFFKGRYYDAGLGRFVARDPLGFVDGMSLYAGHFAGHFGIDSSGTEAHDSDQLSSLGYDVFSDSNVGHGTRCLSWSTTTVRGIGGYSRNERLEHFGDLDQALASDLCSACCEAKALHRSRKYQTTFENEYRQCIKECSTGQDAHATRSLVVAERTAEAIGETIETVRPHPEDVVAGYKATVQGFQEGDAALATSGLGLIVLGVADTVDIIPDPSDVAQRGLRESVEAASKSSRRLPQAPNRGMNNPKVRDAAARGRQAHREFTERVNQKPGWRAGRGTTIEGQNGERLIPDAIDPKGRPVELKPNTPSGRAQGARQIQKYKDATGTNGRVIYYEP